MFGNTGIYKKEYDRSKFDGIYTYNLYISVYNSWITFRNNESKEKHIKCSY